MDFQIGVFLESNCKILCDLIMNFMIYNIVNVESNCLLMKFDMHCIRGVSWDYKKLIIPCLFGVQIYMFKPTNVHMWYEETFPNVLHAYQYS